MKAIFQGKNNFPSRLLLAGILAGLASGIVLLYGIPEAGFTSSSNLLGGSSNTQGRPIVGQPAPHFTSITADGDPISLADYNGQVRLLNFWATWCGPCQLEMPDLQERYQRWQGDGFVVLAVNFDEPAEQVSSFGKELDLKFPLVMDPGGEIQQMYEVRGYPTSYLVDRDGTILDAHIGLITGATLDGWLDRVGLED